MNSKNMTKTWGWLAAGVLAAGLNASYHDGGLRWAHRLVDRVDVASTMIGNLAAGRTDLFLTEARLFLAQDQPSSSLDAALAQVQAVVAEKVAERNERQFVHVEVMPDRKQPALDCAQAKWDRMRARMEANRVRLEARMAEFERVPANFAVAYNLPQAPACPRVRVNVPRMPMIKIPAPAIHLDFSGADPI